MLGEIGAMVKHSTSTMAMTGSTAFKVSLNFSRRFEGRNFNNISPFVTVRIQNRYLPFLV